VNPHPGPYRGLGKQCQRYSHPWVNFINMLTHNFYSHKCSGAHLLFHQQYTTTSAVLYAQLEVTPNFYAVHSTAYAVRKYDQPKSTGAKLFIERWWNWRLLALNPSLVKSFCPHIPYNLNFILSTINKQPIL